MAILPHIDEENDSSWPQEMIFTIFWLINQSYSDQIVLFNVKEK